MARFTVYPSSHYVTRGELRCARSRRSRPSCASGSISSRRPGAWWRRRGSSSARASTSRCWPSSGSARASRTTRATFRPSAGEPPPTLIDYLPQDALMIIDESHVTIPQLGGMYKGDRSRKEKPGRVRLPPALGARQPAAALRRVRGRAPDRLRLGHPGRLRAGELGAGRGAGGASTGLVDPQVAVRPASAQVDDLLSEIHLRTQKSERVLVTT